MYDWSVWDSLKVHWLIQWPIEHYPCAKLLKLQC